MKKIIFLFLLVFTTLSFGQFKDQLDNPPSVYDGIVRNNNSSMFLGFLNPNNFSMHHSFGMSYSSFGNNGMALGIYTNSMMYKFNDKLNVQFDASLINSPYSTFGKGFADQINGIYISKAALNYSPSKNFHINIQYSQSPFGSYYNPYGFSGFYGNSLYGGYNFDNDK